MMKGKYLQLTMDKISAVSLDEIQAPSKCNIPEKID